MIVFSYLGENSDFVFVRFLRLDVVTKYLEFVDALSCVNLPSRFADDLVYDR